MAAVRSFLYKYSTTKNSCLQAIFISLKNLLSHARCKNYRQPAPNNIAKQLHLSILCGKITFEQN